MENCIINGNNIHKKYYYILIVLVDIGQDLLKLKIKFNV